MSVDAKELRIGNWIYCFNPNEKGYPHNLTTQVTLQHFKLMRDEGNFNDYSPIPLTTEILEKCGFKLEYGGQLPDYIQREGFMMYWYEEKLSANFGHVKQMDREIQYLHQLQNLYFALTGKELEINLTL